MVGKILSLDESKKVTQQLHAAKKRIILAGGCFDILHIGHITFLEKAKKKGDVLVVLLESDEKIKKLKGRYRPINSQEDRAKILTSLTVIDYVIPLPPIYDDQEYDELVFTLKPAIIATTAGDPFRFHKERSAEKINAKVVDVIPLINDKSTTRLFHLLKK